MTEIKKQKSSRTSCLIFLDTEDIIVHQFAGDLSEKDIQESISEGELLAKVLHAAGKPVNVLVDVSRVGKIPLNSEKIGLDALKNRDFGKITIVGGGIIFKNLVKAFTAVLGIGNKLKHFDSKTDARKWLLEK